MSDSEDRLERAEAPGHLRQTIGAERDAYTAARDQIIVNIHGADSAHAVLPDPLPGDEHQPGTPIGQLDVFHLEVHPSIDVGASTSGLGELPTYITRNHDDKLRAVLADATAGHSRFGVLVGGSSTGKTRACWEAVQQLPSDWRLWHPINPGRPESAVAGLSSIGPRTVVWLNETQHYLLTPSSNLGEEVAAGLRELLRDPGRAPVLVLGTIWPEYWAELVAPPDPRNREDPHAQARALLVGSGIPVPDSFDGTALDAVEAAARIDPRLAEAYDQAEHGEITQYLAGVPVLLERFMNAPAPARALIEAAIDARRLGHGLALPEELLKSAANGYLSERQWDDLDEDWFEQAVAYTAAHCRGIRPPLRRIRPHRDESHGSPCYRLADYLEQLGRTSRRAKPVPAALWDSLVRHANRDDLVRLASEARRRGLLGYAVKIFVQAGKAGDYRGFAWAAGILKEAGRTGEALVWFQRAAEGGHSRAAMEVSRLRRLDPEYIDKKLGECQRVVEDGNGSMLMEAADMLRSAGRLEEAITWYERAFQAGGMSSPQGDSQRFIADILARERRFDEALIWYERAGQAGSTYAQRSAADMLASAGRVDDALAWYERATQPDIPGVAGDLLRRAGRIDEALAWYGRTDDYYQLRKAAKMLRAQGRFDEALTWYRRAAKSSSESDAAFSDHFMAPYYVVPLMRDARCMLEDAGRAEEAIAWLRSCADAGIAAAVTELARALQDAGQTDEALTYYQRVAEQDSEFAMLEAARMLRSAGRIDEAFDWYRRAVRAQGGKSADDYAVMLLAVDFDAEYGVVNYFEEAASMLAEADRSDEAIIWLQGHAEDGDASVFPGLCVLLLRKGRVDEAAGWYKRLIGEGLSLADHEASYLLSEIDSIEDIISWLQGCSPADHRFAARDAAHLLRLRGRFEEAILWYQRAAALPGAHGGVGDGASARWAADLLRETGRIDHALTWYQYAAEADDKDARGEAARMLEEVGRAQEAVFWYWDAAEQGDEFAGWQARRLLGQSALTDKVIAVLAQDAESGNVDALVQAAQMLKFAGRSSEALILALRAVESGDSVGKVFAISSLESVGRDVDAARLSQYGIEPGGTLGSPDTWNTA